MRILVFASGGDFALLPLQTVATRYEVIGVVRPTRPPSLRAWARRAAKALGLRRGDSLNEWIRREGLRTLPARSGDDPELAARVRSLKPDLIAVVTFPWLVPTAVLEIAPLGALNVHASLLPRHRGPNPFFWTYYHGDLETGVTVHLATARADAGPILRQQSIPLPRGFNIIPLHASLARLGAQELLKAIESVERGDAQPRGQDGGRVTEAPRVPPGSSMARLNEWDVEQAWHFLAGMFPHFREPLVDDRGRRAHYTGVGPFERGGSSYPPGHVEPIEEGWRVHCRGGIVTLRS